MIRFHLGFQRRPCRKRIAEATAQGKKARNAAPANSPPLSSSSPSSARCEARMENRGITRREWRMEDGLELGKSASILDPLSSILAQLGKQAATDARKHRFIVGCATSQDHNDELSP